MRYHGFGGVMMTPLDMDDFTGLFCEEGPYPLLNAINNQLAAPFPVTSWPSPPTTTITALITTTEPPSPPTFVTEPTVTDATFVTEIVTEIIMEEITETVNTTTPTLQPPPPTIKTTTTTIKNPTTTQIQTTLPPVSSTQTKKKNQLPSSPFTKQFFLKELLDLLRKSSISVPGLGTVLGEKTEKKQSLFHPPPPTVPPRPPPLVLPSVAPIPPPPIVQSIDQIQPRRIHIGFGFEQPTLRNTVATKQKEDKWKKSSSRKSAVKVSSSRSKSTTNARKLFPAPSRRTSKPVVRWFDLKELGFFMD